MAKILITGGAGFIGYHLALRLSEDAGNTITIADNFIRGKKDPDFLKLLANPTIKLAPVDLTNWQEVKEKVRGYYDHIYHLAAIVGVKHCTSNPDRVLETNIQSTLNIIKLGRENKCKKMLFSSTCETYAGGFKLNVAKTPTAEDVPLIVTDVKNPRWSYAGSKLVGEQLIIFNSGEFKEGSYEYVILRYHNIYGPRMGYAHMLPEIIKRALAGENPLKVYGHNQTRAFCYIADAIEQTILSMANPQIKNEILHVGNSQEEISIIDGVKQILSSLNLKPALELLAAPAGSVDKRCPDTSKITALTGFIPKVSVSEGFSKTAEWYVQDLKKNGAWE